MAKKKASKVPPSSISARFSPATIQSMDLLRWYIALSNGSPELEESRDKASDTRDSRNQIATQALTWFAKPANHTGVVYPHLPSNWVLGNFTVRPELYSTISKIAEREDVKFARLLEAAFQLYCATMISDEMRSYYAAVQQHGSALLRAREKRRAK
jgi:hypothetical protein